MKAGSLTNAAFFFVVGILKFSPGLGISSVYASRKKIIFDIKSECKVYTYVEM